VVSPAQARRPVACSKSTTASPGFVPTPTTIPDDSSRKMIDQNNAGGPERSGSAELMAAKLRPGSWLCSPTANFRQQSLDLASCAADARRPAARPIRQDQSGDYRGAPAAAATPRHSGPLLEAQKKSGDSAAQSRGTNLVVQYPDATLRVAADQLGSLAATGPAATPHPDLNRMGGVAWSRPRNGPFKDVRKWRSISSRLYAERTGPRVRPSPPMCGPWQLELEDSFPYGSPPQTSQGASARVKRDMESPSRWTAGSAAMWASAKPKWRSGPCSRR